MKEKAEHEEEVKVLKENTNKMINEAIHVAMSQKNNEIQEDLLLIANDRDEWKRKYDTLIEKMDNNKPIDENVLSNKMLVLERELKQSHEDSGRLANRTQTMEDRCLKAEMKYKECQRKLETAQKSLAQMQDVAMMKSSPRLRTNSLASSNSFVLEPAPPSPSLSSSKDVTSTPTKKNKDTNVAAATRTSPLQKYQEAMKTITKLNNDIIRLNSKIIKLDIENVEWKMKAKEQQRMVDQMMNQSPSLENIDSHTSFSSAVDLLKREMLRREHEHNIERMKLQAHLLRVSFFKRKIL